MIIVDTFSDVCTSVQFITVPFRLSLTGLTDNADITGRLFSAELLEKRNMVGPITLLNICRCFGPLFWKVRVYFIGSVSFPEITEKLHSRNLPVVVHVRLRVSPLQTHAVLGGEITTPPAWYYISKLYSWFCSWPAWSAYRSQGQLFNKLRVSNPTIESMQMKPEAHLSVQVPVEPT